ncbi:hypothetical protein ESA94_16015 [Lacibacter luteus]|uniref:Tetratricopeptide repeat protein n=1 Tax=Lacibacter luteus TaxID=2508719 RepID=A0A4Q1CFT9_9BACT|nr:hypothetical protein [Lacibacter luteus]RXK58892.1 hypothetical protein ESA94_16015 [Lacibacter luteus]
MQFEIFTASINTNELPAGINIYLQSLWYDAKDNWHKAHALVDSLNDNTACWVHAYLHRKEGDIGNADYWYRRAGKVRPTVSLQQEWETIVKALL